MVSPKPLATSVLSFLARLGVKEVVLCPGRRNAAFVSHLERSTYFTTYSFFEERSAAFFALGRIKREGAPVAVITTSGTACAELLPATIEAFYSGAPLILVTADRPRRLRGSGAPQTIEQVGLFSSYVEWCFDIDNPSDLNENVVTLRKPLHLNVCFDEPLDLSFTEIETPYTNRAAASLTSDGERLLAFWQSISNPLICCGPLAREHRETAIDFLIKLNCPLFLEATSNLKGEPRLSHLELQGGNSLVVSFLEEGLFDSVLRIGGVPAARFWRDLDEKFRKVRVFSVSERPFIGCERGELEVFSYETLFTMSFPNVTFSQRTYGKLFQRDADFTRAKYQLISKYPWAEPVLFNTLSREVPQGTNLYLGNSLPIREWDLCSENCSRLGAVEANRGANGIDGQFSTFLGWCRGQAPHWGIFGDLTALYDLSAPWAQKMIRDTPILLVIINNGGGQIFSRMFESNLFLNQHHISFQGWASMWELPYVKWEKSSSDLAVPERGVLEIMPCPAQTDSFWSEFSSIQRQV